MFRVKLEVVLLVTPSFEMFVKPGVCSTLRAFGGEVNSDIEDCTSTDMVRLAFVGLGL